jgi:ATP-dependent DNA helicase RecG
MFKENEYIELKKTTSELKEGIISICSILNKNGEGELYFGFKNDGTLVGQQVSDKTLRDISQSISNHLEPKIFPIITHETQNNIDYIKVIFSGTDAPYYAYGRAYMRVADEDKLLSPAELEKMIMIKNLYQTKWDSKISVYDFDLADKEQLNSFVQQLKSAGRTSVKEENPETVLEKLDLLKSGKLSYAAWYLFSKKQPLELQLAVFRGKDKNSFNDIKSYKGNLFYLLEVAKNYIIDKINWRVEFGADMKRHEIPEIPVDALREAIVNSFAHRNFNDPKPNEIAIFTDRIEIYNPGTFPAGLKPEDYILGKERSHLRNPKIAETLYFTRDIDRWGSGLQRISNECREKGIQYGFDLLSNGFLTTFVRPVSAASDMVESGGKNTDETITEGGKKSSATGGKKSSATGSKKSSATGSKKDDDTGGKKTSVHTNGIIIGGEYLKLPARQKDVLILIANNNKITIAKVAEILGINNSAAQKHFEALKTKNIITRLKGDKGGYWNIIINIEKLGI